MILGVPFGGGGLGKTVGAAKAAAQILERVRGYVSEHGVLVSPRCELMEIDAGNIADSFESIFRRVGALETGSVIVGGDHSITHAALRAFVKKYPGAGVVVFDAHLDMMQPFSVPTHENFLRQAIHDGIVRKDRVVVVGHRVSDPEEEGFVRRENIITYPMREIAQEGMQATCDAVMAAVREWPHAYLSIDIDVLDPAFAPGTGYAETGGMSTRELLYFVQRLLLLRNIRMADVVEVNPDHDVRGMTVSAAAKIVLELYSSLNKGNI